VAHFWPDSAWWPRVNGALASKLGIHIKVWFIIAYIFFSEYLQVGKGQWPGEWGGPVTSEIQ